MEKQKEGEFGGKECPSLRKRKVNPALLKLVDELIVEYFHNARAGKPMWTLSWLVPKRWWQQRTTMSKRLSGFIDNCSRKIREDGRRMGLKEIR